MKKDGHMYTSTLLTSLGISHGYSTRWFGDMRVIQSRNKFIKRWGHKIIIAQQVHGVRIKRVGKPDHGYKTNGYDGLVSDTGVLGVTFADCVPILAADIRAGIIGTAHAGWKGTLAGIAKELVLDMEAVGADRKNIFISIGPHIGMCCYSVHDDRARAFRQIFGVDEKIASRIQGQWYLDIGYANYRELLEVGIDKEHIDAPPTCTSCQIVDFNSYRKDPKEKFGVQLGVVAL